MSKEKMYLVELKIGEATIKKYIMNEMMLQYLMNDLNYDSVKIIEEIDILDTGKTRVKRKRGK